MTTIDPVLVAALDIRRERRAEFDRDPAAEHVLWQTSSIDALLEGAYDGDLTLAELMGHGDLGIGTVQHLDGELIVIDGRAFRVAADGTVHEPDPSTRTPFAVVCQFEPGEPIGLEGPLSLAELTSAIDAAAPVREPVVALRVDGEFGPLHLRSVARQHPPYPSLAEVVRHQTEWEVESAHGSIVGFRFPDYAQGIDVAGYHLHFLSDDRTVGGHVIDATLHAGQLLVDGAHELHLEVPLGTRVGDADTSEAKAGRHPAGRGRSLNHPAGRMHPRWGVAVAAVSPYRGRHAAARSRCGPVGEIREVQSASAAMDHAHASLDAHGWSPRVRRVVVPVVAPVGAGVRGARASPRRMSHPAAVRRGRAPGALRAQHDPQHLRRRESS